MCMCIAVMVLFGAFSVRAKHKDGREMGLGVGEQKTTHVRTEWPRRHSGRLGPRNGNVTMGLSEGGRSQWALGSV